MRVSPAGVVGLIASISLTATAMTGISIGPADALDTVPNTDASVPNPGFEAGVGTGQSAWTTEGPNSNHTTMASTDNPHSGILAGKVYYTGPGISGSTLGWVRSPAILNKFASTRYRVSVWVRVTDPAPTGTKVTLHVHDSGTTAVQSITKTITDTAWQQLSFTPLINSVNSQLDVRVSMPSLSTTRSLFVDDLAIRPLPRFPGDPGAGNVYYGASSTGLHTRAALPPQPQTFESTAIGGAPLPVHRTFFRYEPPFTSGNIEDPEVAVLVNQVDQDHAQGRLPHVSIKVANWGQVGAAGASPELDDLLNRLAGPEPVFLTLHHEPEDDNGTADNGSVFDPADPNDLSYLLDDYTTGTPAAWVAMQKKAISRAKTLAPNVTIVPILMANKFDPADPATREAEKQWIVDTAAVIGLDGYNRSTNPLAANWKTLGQRIDDVVTGLGTSALATKPIVIGEYGVQQIPGNADETWMYDAIAQARDRNVVAMSYFNSNAGPTGAWAFTGVGDDRQVAFASILANHPSVFRTSDIVD